MGKSLAPCKGTPNCVCSEDTRERHAIAPFAPTRGNVEALWKKLKEVMGQEPRTTLVDEQPDYLHYEARSAVFRFVDDVEFSKTADLIHVRSASRLGRKDFGVNRQRIERLRQLVE